VDYPDLHPDFACFDAYFPLIRFLDRSFQPHLDQMEHVPVYDPASYRL